MSAQRKKGSWMRFEEEYKQDTWWSDYGHLILAGIALVLVLTFVHDRNEPSKGSLQPAPQEMPHAD